MKTSILSILINCTILVICIVSILSGPPRGFRGQAAKLQNEAPRVCDRSKQEGQKISGGGGLNLAALLEPCRQLLLQVSLNTSKEAINKTFDIG